MHAPFLLLTLCAAIVCSTPCARADWPQYRGPGASGVDDAHALPLSWNVETGENVRWHTAIPGLAHSSPIVFEDRIYVATAVSEKEAELKVGLYGDIPVPTPIFAHGLIYLSSAHGDWRPMRAIRPDATGDITPADPGSTNSSIAWAHGRKGNYMQTPIIAGDLLLPATTPPSSHASMPRLARCISANASRNAARASPPRLCRMAGMRISPAKSATSSSSRANPSSASRPFINCLKPAWPRPRSAMAPCSSVPAITSSPSHQEEKPPAWNSPRKPPPPKKNCLPADPTQKKRASDLWNMVVFSEPP